MAVAQRVDGPSAAVPLGQPAADRAAERMRFLEGLATNLAPASSVDDVTRVVLSAVAQLPEVIRGGLALSRAGGRELRFTSLHQDDVAGRVGWCGIDASADLPVVISSRTGRPLWFPTLQDLAARFPELAEHQRRFGTAGFAVLPLVTGSQVIGALMLGYATDQPFTEFERAFLAAFASQAAHAINRVVAWDQQRDLAELLQYSLLPAAVPELQGVAMAARYDPSQGGLDVGGDWFDVIPLPDGSVMIVIGDVMGRGVDAATFMGQIRTALRAYALLDPAPDGVLDRLDVFMSGHDQLEQIVTVLVALIDADRGLVRVSSAGHPPPIRAPAGGPARTIDLIVGPPLGLSGGDRPVRTVPLAPDDVWVLYTDGLVESVARPIGEGIEQLRAALDSHIVSTRVPRELTTLLAAAMASAADDDDRALVVIASTVGRQSRSAQLELPGDARAAGRSRRWLQQTLSKWNVDRDLIDEAVLCLSEVVTNAVIHSGTPPRVSATLDDTHLLVTVVDSGRHGRAQLLVGDPEDIGGRGLVVVDALATAWHAERRADGTLVWFQFSLAGRGSL